MQYAVYALRGLCIIEFSTVVRTSNVHLRFPQSASLALYKVHTSLEVFMPGANIQIKGGILGDSLVDFLSKASSHLGRRRDVWLTPKARVT